MEFELNNMTPNFITYINKFKFNFNDVIVANKHKLNEACHDCYDLHWKVELNNSPKAATYKMYKNNINF